MSVAVLLLSLTGARAQVCGLTVGVSTLASFEASHKPAGVTWRPDPKHRDGWSWWRIEGGKNVLRLYWSIESGDRRRLTGATLEPNVVIAGKRVTSGAIIKAKALGLLADLQPGSSFPPAKTRLDPKLGICKSSSVQAEWAWSEAGHDYRLLADLSHSKVDSARLDLL